MKVLDRVKDCSSCNMGALLSCIYSPPKDVIDPVVLENKVVIITDQAESEELGSLQALLEKHEIGEEDIKVHIIEENCHKGRMIAHVVEMNGGEELPFPIVMCNGEPLGAYDQVMAMADTGDLYKALHGKEKVVEQTQNVKQERRTSVLGFFDNKDDKKKKSTKKRKNSNVEPDNSSINSSKK